MSLITYDEFSFLAKINPSLYLMSSFFFFKGKFNDIIFLRIVLKLSLYHSMKDTHILSMPVTLHWLVLVII